jgi:protein-disulfide isomerase
MDVQVSASDHVRGNSQAAVVLLEYADFECPYCGMAEPYVERTFERFQDKMALVFRSFPLMEIHPHALRAAEAAEAAGLQGKFWQMHDILFKHQQHLDDGDLLRYAEKLGLDVERFQRDITSPAVSAAVRHSLQEGADQGVAGTPSFFLNGVALEIGRYEDIESAVAQAVKTSG